MACLGAATAAVVTPTAAHAEELVAGSSPNNCPTLSTLQIPIQERGDEVDVLDAYPVAAGPEDSHIRTEQINFNRVFDFAIKDGSLIVRNHRDATWHWVPLHPCLSGKIVALSSDDDEVLLVDEQRRMYTLDRVTSHPSKWQLSHLWGAPFWFGWGRKVPSAGVGSWAYSVNNRNFDQYYVDAAGKRHPIGAGRITMILGIVEGGNRVVMLDPWLPNDDSYSVPMPEAGRLVAKGLSVSGSAIVVVDPNGNFFARSWDFDRSGADVAFFRAEWADQSRLPDANSKAQENLDRRFAALQLPAADWSRMPTPPGRFTQAVSVDAPEHRVRRIRVEGADSAGHTGYWEIVTPLIDIELGNMADKKWTFHRTDAPVQGEWITHRNELVLSAPQGPRLTTMVDGRELVIDHFDLRGDRLPVTWGGEPAILHTIDGLRLLPAASTLNNTPRLMGGAIVQNGVTRQVTMVVTQNQLWLL